MKITDYLKQVLKMKSKHGGVGRNELILAVKHMDADTAPAIVSAVKKHKGFDSKKHTRNDVVRILHELSERKLTIQECVIWHNGFFMLFFEK